MKYRAVIVITLIFSFCSAALAAPAGASEPAAWAYSAMDRLAQEGLLASYPEGYFDGERALSRYEFALAARELGTWLELNIISSEAEVLASAIQREFASELAALAARAREASGESGSLLARSEAVATESYSDRFRIDRLRDLTCDVTRPSPFSGAVRYRVGLVDANGRQDSFQRVDFLLGYREEVAPGVLLNFELGSDWNGGVFDSFDRDPLSGDLKLKRAFLKFSN